MQRQKVFITKESKTLDILDDVNIDEKTLEFLTETFGDAQSGTSDESKRLAAPTDLIEQGHDLVAIESDPILAHDITTRNKLERILKLRKFVHRQIVLSERACAICIRYLIMCKKLFENDLRSSDPLLTQEELNTLFYKVEDIKSLVDELSGRLEESFVNWSAGVRIFPAYQSAMDKMHLLTGYESNLVKARKVIESKGGAEVFDEIVSGELPIIEKSFEELLDQPLRLQKRMAYSIRVNMLNTDNDLQLIKKEVLKYTPEEHNDHDEMKASLHELAYLLDHYCFLPKAKENNSIQNSFIQNMSIILETSSMIKQEPKDICAYYILKSGYIVQQKENIRKLRYLFLFPTCLIITKPKIAYGSVRFGIKGVILLKTIMLQVTENPDDQHIEGSNNAKKNLVETKSDLEKFLRNSDSKQTIFKKWKIYRLKQRIYKNEAKLLLFTPSIKLTIKETNNQTKYIFFLTSHFDVDDWVEMIENVKNDESDKSHTEDAYRNSIKDFQLVPRLTAFKPEATVNRYLNGTLDVYIHQIKGFDQPHNSYLTLQVDCFGGFFMKIYKTNMCRNMKDPVFNQKFEILLDSSHLLKISLYTNPTNNNKGCLQGSAIFDMQTASLHSGYRLHTLSLYPVQTIIVAMSLRYAYHQVGFRRKYSVIPSNSLEKVKNMRGKVFEEDLNTVITREGRKLPLVLTSCVEEIESRGLNEKGIYAAEGNSEQLKDLMALFDLCSLTGARYLKDKKYSAVTIGCLLKAYIKKLRFPLISEPSYFLAAFDSPDKETKHNKMLKEIKRLADPEHAMFCYLIDHLIRVSKNESQNKMSVQALAAVFGPCILQKEKSSASEESIKDMEKFKMVIEYIIGLKINGADFDKDEEA